MVNIKQGDIIKIDFNPVKGHEQGGFIPAMVVSNNLLISSTNIVSICPITSKQNKTTAFNVRLEETKTQGGKIPLYNRAGLKASS
jgi:mRNA interferase MazF